MGKILIVEDEAITYLDLKIKLEEMGHQVISQSSDLVEAVSMTITSDPDIIIMDISINGPDDGIITAQIISRDLLKPIVFISGYTDSTIRLRVNRISNSVFLTKPFSTDELYRAIEDLTDCPLAKSLSDDNSSNIISTDALCRFLFTSSPETAIHSYRMKSWSMIMADQLNFDETQRKLLGDATLLHDIGKMLIPRSILDKSEQLTDDEFSEIQKHPVFSDKILIGQPGIHGIKPLIRHHHEKWDGSGYPDRLEGMEIPIGSRIIALVDTFDVMTHDRIYKKAVSPAQALDEIRRCAGSQFDPVLADLFIQCVSNADVFSFR